MLLPSTPQQAVVIWGLGKEGLSSYHFLRSQLPDHDMIAIDDKPVAELSPEWQAVFSQDPKLRFVPSETTATSGLTPGLVVKAPGIPLHHPLWTVIKNQNWPLTTNSQLFLEVLKAHFPNVITIGVTGTKGKSTTASVIHHILVTAGKKTWLGGNIGVPALDLLSQLQSTSSTASEPEYVVLELSCHQLNDMTISPHIAVIQNIVPEHLDYYGTFSAYLEAKSHIARHQTATDFVVYNPTHETASQLANLSPGTKLTFDATTPPAFLAHITLKGKHNLENILPGIVIAQNQKIDENTIAQAIESFKPLPHRLEYVATVNGVEYYNDSLATVPAAAIAAIEAFPDKQLVMILGGFDRGLDYKTLGEKLAKTPLRGLVLFPTTGKDILAQLQAFEPNLNLPILEANDMQTAVSHAHHLAQAGDVVLLSPAAASYNMFKDFADRGDQFKQAVMALSTPAASAT